jgi:Xaa-Pro dipeptidase
MIITPNSKKPENYDPNFDISDIPITSLIPLTDHYYSDNRARLLETMKAEAENFSQNSIALFKGHYKHATVHDTDSTATWMPEWNFHYLFGLKDEFDCYGIIDFSNMETTIVLKEKSEETLIFEGGLCVDDDASFYGFTRFISVDDLENFVRDRNAEKVYVMKGMIRDELSNYASFPWLDKMPQLDSKWLYFSLCKQRCIKSEEEIV